MSDGRTVSRSQAAHGFGRQRTSDDIKDSRAMRLYSRVADVPHDAPCASGAHCVAEPAARVTYRGDVCAACRRVRAEMAARLRAKR